MTRADIAQDGRFAACGLPIDTPFELIAWRGADSTGVLEFELPRDRIGRLDLTVGPTRTETLVRVSADGVADSTTSLRGTGRMRGVVTGLGGAPVANARIRVHETRLESRTRGDGSFTMADLPLGSHQVEVYALGSRPFVGIVNLDSANVADIRVTMDHVPTLDTLLVVAMRVDDPNLARDLIGFERRRISGIGAFMTHEDIKAKFAARFEDLFVGRSDVQLRAGAEFTVVMRNWNGSRASGAFGGGVCTPNVFLDGFPVKTAGFLNGLRSVEHVVAVEIYEKPWTVPAEIAAPAGSPCGSIAFWTTQRVQSEKKEQHWRPM